MTASTMANIQHIHQQQHQLSSSQQQHQLSSSQLQQQLDYGIYNMGQNRTIVGQNETIVGQNETMVGSNMINHKNDVSMT